MKREDVLHQAGSQICQHIIPNLELFINLLIISEALISSPVIRSNWHFPLSNGTAPARDTSPTDAQLQRGVCKPTSLGLRAYPLFPVCPKEHSQSYFFHEIFSPLPLFLNPIYQIVEAKDKHYNPSVRHLWHSKGSLPWCRSCFECL